MPNLTFNTKNTNKVPISTNNLFYSQESLMFENEIGMNYLTQDCNQTCVYYEVDIEKSNLDSVYNETKLGQIVFKAPVELHCLYNIEDSELRAYNKDKNLGTYVKSGKLEVYIFIAELEEYSVNPKNGDYISIQTTPIHKENYKIINDGRNNYSNEMSIYGLPSTWRKIICAPSQEQSEFEGGKL